MTASHIFLPWAPMTPTTPTNSPRTSRTMTGIRRPVSQFPTTRNSTNPLPTRSSKKCNRRFAMRRTKPRTMTPRSLAAHRGMRLALPIRFLLSSSLRWTSTQGRHSKLLWRKRTSASSAFARRSALARVLASTSGTATVMIYLVDVSAAAETPFLASRH